jgi:hypothetical protein
MVQVNFSTDGRYVMSGDGEGKCYFWDWKVCIMHLEDSSVGASIQHCAFKVLPTKTAGHGPPVGTCAHCTMLRGCSADHQDLQELQGA